MYLREPVMASVCHFSYSNDPSTGYRDDFR
jgi:hypothetical protein